MGRPLRIQFEHAWYHVMNRGASRQDIFIDKQDKMVFLDTLADAIRIYRIEVHAYCLMSNHYHLLIHTPHPDLSEAMRHLNSLYTRKFNKRHGRDGALFRGRYKAIIVGAEEYLLRLSRYIHRNPLEAGIIQELEKYKWSSYPAYIEASEPVKWLSMGVIKKRFSRRRRAGEMYRFFVEGNTDEGLKRFFNNDRFLPVFGSEKFKEKILEYADSQCLSSEVVGRNRVRELPSMEQIAAFVAKCYSIDPSVLRLLNGGSDKRRMARKVAIILCREEGLCLQRAIASFFGGMVYSSVSKLIYRAKNNAVVMNEVSRLRKIFSDKESSGD